MEPSRPSRRGRGGGGSRSSSLGALPPAPPCASAGLFGAATCSLLPEQLYLSFIPPFSYASVRPSLFLFTYLFSSPPAHLFIPSSVYPPTCPLSTHRSICSRTRPLSSCAQPSTHPPVCSSAHHPSVRPLTHHHPSSSPLSIRHHPSVSSSIRRFIHPPVTGTFSRILACLRTRSLPNTLDF